MGEDLNAESSSITDGPGSSASKRHFSSASGSLVSTGSGGEGSSSL